MIPADGTQFMLIAKQVHYYTWIHHKRITSIEPYGPGTELKVTANDGRWTIVDLHKLQSAPPDRKPELVWHGPEPS